MDEKQTAVGYNFKVGRCDGGLDSPDCFYEDGVLAAFSPLSLLLPLHDGDRLTSSADHLGLDGFEHFQRIQPATRPAKSQRVTTYVCGSSGLAISEDAATYGPILVDAEVGVNGKPQLIEVCRLDVRKLTLPQLPRSVELQPAAL